MNSRGTFLPRVLATILLLVSLSMLVPLSRAAFRMWHGAPLQTVLWLWPLLLFAAGVALTYVLSRRQVSFQLYAAAFALWLMTAGYYWVIVVRS